MNKRPFKKAKKDKKAIMTFNLIAFIPRLIFLAIGLLACVILLRLMVNSQFNVKNTQAEVLLNGMLFGPGGLTSYDPLTGRITPEVVDIRQFDEKKMNLGFNYHTNKMIAARAVVTDSKREFTGVYDYDDAEKVVYFNKQWWDNWLPLAKAKLKGFGAFDIDESEVPIIYIDNDGDKHSGFMYVTIIQPK